MSSDHPEHDKPKKTLPTSTERASDAELISDEGTPEKIIVGETFSVYSGPLPSPQILKEYEDILPGAADRIFSTFESEKSHRHKIENQVVEAGIEDQKEERKQQRMGQFFGFLIGITALLIGGYVSVIGSPLAGGFIGTSGVIGLVSVFVTGRKQSMTNQNNLEEHDDEPSEEKQS